MSNGCPNNAEPPSDEVRPSPRDTSETRTRRDCPCFVRVRTTRYGLDDGVVQPEAMPHARERRARRPAAWPPRCRLRSRCCSGPPRPGVTPAALHAFRQLVRKSRIGRPARWKMYGQSSGRRVQQCRMIASSSSESGSTRGCLFLLWARRRHNTAALWSGACHSTRDLSRVRLPVASEASQSAE
jgi:hypothetical protein